MDDEAISRSPTCPPRGDKPANKLSPGIKAMLGTVFVLAFVVVVLQLSMMGIFSDREREREETFFPPDPEKAVAVAVAPPSAVERPAPIKARTESPEAPSPQATDVNLRARELARRLSDDTTSLIGIVAELSDRLELVQEELSGTRALYAAAARKIVQFEKEFVSAQRQSAEIQALSSQLAESRALLSVAERRSEALMGKLAASPDPKVFRDAQAMRDVYEAELRDTKQRLARDETQKARLQAELSVATSALAATETALDSTELFIDSIDLLPEAAKQLFLELSRLETVDHSELLKNYRQVEQKLGVRVADTIRFATGKSEVSPAEAATIRAAMQKGREDSFFLVIGYASKTGNFDLNKELSSARATAVATLAVEIARPGQDVRAVFLGQTDRFSATDVRDDQICELWEIPR